METPRKNTQLQHVEDEALLAQLQEVEACYNLSVSVVGVNDATAAMAETHASSLSLLEGFERYHQLRSDGWCPLDPMHPTNTVRVYGIEVYLTLYKPAKQQTEELAVIQQQVRGAWSKKVESRQQAELEARIQATIAAEAAQIAEQRAREDAERAAAIREAMLAGVEVKDAA